ncbi:retron system putative HNH endonuclease [Microbacterium sp. CFBP9023]|uniref:retron system putative HNH endonuclease n=1 Tax=Microbacterium sp. CFBP9023 TaxID=3096535 RepID=UPI002A6AED7C|nr:retron system putative HNH endonuclease [Microbacterium sp. CFBP9023]MDY0983153.1 retron system putative HNH endonuclease [Microbacterium sp. CFBP9023]
MHLLDRGGVRAPDCLDDYDYSDHTWKQFGKACKREVRARLVEMQGIPGVSAASGANEYGVRCAYCEGPIYVDGHIEHFRRKNPAHFPELTFEWSNLFLACRSVSHCGHFKDRRSSDSYSPADLVKPDERDPEAFLFFSSNGRVYPKDGLDSVNMHIATETIRVFNLNDDALAARRRSALKPYFEQISEFLDLGIELDPHELFDDLASEILRTQYEAYATTIKHFLRPH